MSKTFAVWLYADETGWWLEEEGYDDAGDACAALATFLSRSLVGQEVAVWWSGGAVVPAGEFPMPMCEKCLRRPRRKHGHRWSGAGHDLGRPRLGRLGVVPARRPAERPAAVPASQRTVLTPFARRRRAVFSRTYNVFLDGRPWGQWHGDSPDDVLWYVAGWYKIDPARLRVEAS
jgi:hypothetical protein